MYENLSTVSRFTIIRKGILFSWLAVLGFLFILYLSNPLLFSPQKISDFISEFQQHIWLAYIVVTFFRGFFLIPSTPFVLAGVLLFPGQPGWVLSVSMTGVLFSATLLYFFPGYLGVDKYLYSRYGNKMKKIHRNVNKPNAFWLILGWSIFPFVPTDLICNVAGAIRMKYIIMISGVFLGEGTLNSFYVFGGAKMMFWM